MRRRVYANVVHVHRRKSVVPARHVHSIEGTARLATVPACLLGIKVASFVVTRGLLHIFRSLDREKTRKRSGEKEDNGGGKTIGRECFHYSRGDSRERLAPTGTRASINSGSNRASRSIRFQVRFHSYRVYPPSRHSHGMNTVAL